MKAFVAEVDGQQPGVEPRLLRRC